MKLSFSTLGSPWYNMDQILELAKTSGYEGIEIRAVSGTADLATLDEFKGAGLARTAEKARAAGIEVVCIGTSVRFNVASAKEQQDNLELAKFSMDIANALGSPYIRTFGGPLVPTQGYEESLKWIREGYEKLDELSAAEGVIPLMETHDDFSTAPRILDILDSIEAPNIGVIWDILHPYRFGEAPAATYKALSDRIRHIHIKDSAEFSPKGFDLTLVGEGKVPVGECIDLLKGGGYDGYLSFEWEKLWHPEIPDTETAIPHYVTAIKKYL